MRKPTLRAAASGRGLAAAAALRPVVLGLLALGLTAGGAAAAPADPLKWPADVERPPLQYASGPTQYGQTREREFSALADLQAFCNLYLGKPAKGAYEACYIPAMELVVLPDEKARPDPAGRAALRDHEWAHARGWRHTVPTATASMESGVGRSGRGQAAFSSPLPEPLAR